MSEANPTRTKQTEPAKTASSVKDVKADHTPFGSRYLTPDADVWSKSAWDHVPAPPEQSEYIVSSLERQRNSPVPDAEREKYNALPSRYWNIFYRHNTSNFFKDRRWLHVEFPELTRATQVDAGPTTILEIGCGAGNTAFPLLKVNQNPDLNLIACDFSWRAIDVVKSNPLFTSPNTIGTMKASIWDLSSPPGSAFPEGVTPGSVDIVIAIFVLSALHPDEWQNALRNIYTMLKPNGLVLFRDYGRHDLAQLRLKEGRFLSENFYIRGDGTRVYFFELDEIAELFTGSRTLPSNVSIKESVSEEDEQDLSTPRTPGAEDLSSTVSRLQIGELDSAIASTSHPVPNISAISDSSPIVSKLPNSETPKPKLEQIASPTLDNATELSSRSSLALPTPTLPTPPTQSPLSSLPSNLQPEIPIPPHPLFTIEQLGVDRRLLINRKRQLKMYRVWMQGKFRKIG